MRQARTENGGGFNVVIKFIKRFYLALFFLAALGSAITTNFGGDENEMTTGGHPVKNLSGWEFIASIQTDEPICSGIILKSNSVLTTCKCGADIIKQLWPLRTEIYIIVGTHRTDNKSIGQWRMVDHVIKHPYCKKETIYQKMAGYIFDYAVVKVADFVLGANVKPIKLKTWNKRDLEFTIIEALKYSEHCEVAGWGRTVILFPTVYEEPSPVLLQMTLKLLTYDECSNIACRGGYNIPYCTSSVVLTGKFCAVPIGPGNSCRGDEGGPLVCDGYVLGLISYIKSCGEYYQPNYYARLDVGLPFIKKFVEMNSEIRTVSGFKTTILPIIVIFLTK
ncbi:hypothetical protein GE061_004242 [Apolygus lucorum]|uniref:Uncharacterized protein n=1 Tax=Apolygus lucorum TaxID=248454 RepID=A0A6A4IXM2_APOLU|nr:hypothetical protein GE061_004242 [Apolygus lucorum]